MVSQVVQVFSRRVYGVAKVYPANQLAQQFAALIGVKTFSHAQLCQVEAMGFVIVGINDPAAAVQVAA